MPETPAVPHPLPSYSAQSPAATNAGDATGWAPSGPAEPADARHTQELVQWQDLLGQVGRELAEPLTVALERVSTLTTTGRIDRHGLRALRDEIERARQAGILCQQMSRMASGGIRQTHERVHLSNTVQGVLANRSREIHSKGIVLSQALLPFEVQADASMLFALLNVMVDWWLECAHGTVAMRIDMRNWPAHARMQCSFPALPPDVPLQDDDVMLTRVSTLRWNLLAQTARSMGLPLERHCKGHMLTVTLEFPSTVSGLMADVDTHQDSQPFEDSINSQPLAGSHVLVVASRRDLRQQVREALKGMGLVLDFCASVKDAVVFCKSGLPHAIVFEGELRNPVLERLMAHLRTEVPDFVFIELVPEGRTFDISGLQTTGLARVGCEGIAYALPSALVYELSRVM